MMCAKYEQKNRAKLKYNHILPGMNVGVESQGQRSNTGIFFTYYKFILFINIDAPFYLM